MGLVAGLLVGLLMLQPDFGNAMVLLFVSGVMLFLAGGRVAYLLGAAAVCAPIAWALVMGAEYRRRRLLAFLDPWADPQNTSYQIVQSFTAFFSGGWWGQGLGNGQEKLHYLPEVHTDFIAAVVGEELGFVAVILMILAFLLLLYRGYRIAMNASDRSGFLLAAGCTTLIGLQVVLNLGVVMGLLPTKGLPLPFISHGGSSILMSFLACGLILSVAKKGAISSREAGEI
jgi:cell division protein FtsW